MACGPLRQVFPVVYIEDGEAGGHRYRVPTVREDVLEGGRRVHECLANVVANRHRRERGIAAADALAQDHEVGHDAVVLDAEVAAGPTEARDDLVDDQQHAVAIADLADLREVFGLRLDGSAHRRHDGLGDERRDTLRADPQDLSFQLVRARHVARGIRQPERTAVAVDRRDVRHVQQHRQVFGPPADSTAHGQAAQGRAVIARPAADHLVALRLAPIDVVLARHLEGHLDGLRSATREMDPVQVAGRQVGDAAGQLDRWFVGEDVAGVVGEPGRLGGHGLGHFGSAVADVDNAQTSDGVEVAVAVDVPDIDVIGMIEDRVRPGRIQREEMA